MNDFDDLSGFSFEGIQDSLQLGGAKKEQPGVDRFVYSREEKKEELYNPLDGVDLHSDTLHFSRRPGAPLLVSPGVPDDFEAYKRALLEAFGPLDEALIERLFKEKLLVSAYRSWSPGDPNGNRLLAERSFEIVSRAMGEIYAFKPSPLAFGNLYRDNAIGLFLYGKGWEKVVLSKKLLTRSYRSVLETMVHEQLHRLQHSLICRLNQTMTAPLPENLHPLVLFWLRDEPNRQAGYQAAARNPREARAILRGIAVEYQAYERSEYVLGKLFPSSGS